MVPFFSAGRICDPLLRHQPLHRVRRGVGGQRARPPGPPPAHHDRRPHPDQLQLSERRMARVGLSQSQHQELEEAAAATAAAGGTADKQ